MPSDKNTLISVLKKSFPDAKIEAKSLTGDDDHWEVFVKDQSFAEKTRIAQHRAVQDSLNHLNIHAVSIKTSC